MKGMLGQKPIESESPKFLNAIFVFFGSLMGLMNLLLTPEYTLYFKMDIIRTHKIFFLRGVVCQNYLLTG